MMNIKAEVIKLKNKKFFEKQKNYNNITWKMN